MAIPISDKGYFRIKIIAKYKDCDLIMTKGPNNQEDIIILNVSSLKKQNFKYIRQKAIKKIKL